MCPFKQLQIKKQSNIYCIYMTSLRCVFTLSLSDVLSLLKKSVGGCFCCMDSDCSGPLCELVEAFGRGADNCSITARLLRPAHLFRPFLRRVWGEGSIFINIKIVTKEFQHLVVVRGAWQEALSFTAIVGKT